MSEQAVPPPAGRLPVLVVDDHELVSASLTMVLRLRGHDAHRCDVRNPDQILAVAAGLPPGIVLLDLDLGVDERGERLSGVDLVDDLAADGWRVVAVTGMVDRSPIAAAVTAGAVAVLEKSGAIEDLFATIEAVAAGRTLIDPVQRRAWTREHRRAEAADRRLELLTSREREILDDLAVGRRAGAIATAAGVSVATVRTHIRAILAKLEVGSQLEAVARLRGRA